MHSNLKYSAICLVILVIFVLPFKAFAASSSSISISQAPENPSANQDTTITLSSYASNLDSVSISWFVNGKKVSSLIGQKSFSTKAPAVGGEVAVRAVISLPDGEIEKTITIRPNVMVLLWQVKDSYVPPFYRGKALPTPESEIKVVAMPEVRNTSGTVNPKNMIYNWKINYNNDAGGSGYGKNFFTYINDYLEDADNIGVTASTTDGKYSSNASVNVVATSPQISFYKSDPSLGTLWEEALSDGHRIVGDEIVVAEPYFISPKEIWSPGLLWNWSINDSLIKILDYRKNLLPLRVESGISGISKLRLVIESKDQLLETAEKEINIEF